MYFYEYVLPRNLWAGLAGGQIFLRLASAKNGQSQNIHPAENYREAWDLLNGHNTHQQRVLELAAR